MGWPTPKGDNQPFSNPLIEETIMARKKPRKKTSVRTKSRAALKAKDRFVRRELQRRNGRSEEALITADNPFGRVVGVYLELPFRLARCVTPFQVWTEQLLAGQKLLSAWHQR
jgi:hypothetical protein